MAFTFFESENELGLALALKQAQSEGAKAFAFSGGKSPIALFKSLQNLLDASSLSISLVDERLGSPMHEDSNELLLRKYLLAGALARANFTGLLPERQINETELIARLNANYKQPDVVVLGMGEDSHFASIFPCCDELDLALNQKPGYLITKPKTAPYTRITLSYKAIKAARYIFLAISGEAKLKVFEKASQKSDKALPISLLLHDEGVNVHVYYHR